MPLNNITAVRIASCGSGTPARDVTGIQRTYSWSNQGYDLRCITW